MMLLNMVAVQLMIYFLKCSMTIILKWYFESIFIPKKDCDDRHFEITFFLSWGQHNLQIDFYAIHFEMINDFHFEMSKAFLFSFWNALWLSFWNEGRKIFVHKNIFVIRFL